MRKIEVILRDAWMTGKACSISNSQVVTANNSAYLVLFGNTIAKRENGKTSFTLAGFNTVTTRSRLRNVLGLPLWNEARLPRYLRKENVIDSREWYDVAQIV